MPLSREMLDYIIVKARGFDAEVAPGGLEDGSNAADDNEVAILEDSPDNPTERELVAALRSLDRDALAELLALVRVGRGDYDRASWGEALAEAQADVDEQGVVRYLVGTPLLGDLIENGLAEVGDDLFTGD
jgi:hypothetical protein